MNLEDYEQARRCFVRSIHLSDEVCAFIFTFFFSFSLFHKHPPTRTHRHPHTPPTRTNTHETHTRARTSTPTLTLNSASVFAWLPRQDSTAWNNLAAVSTKLGRKEEALRAYREAIRLGEDWRIYDNFMYLAMVCLFLFFLPSSSGPVSSPPPLVLFLPLAGAG